LWPGGYLTRSIERTLLLLCSLPIGLKGGAVAILPSSGGSQAAKLPWEGVVPTI
jgi:hypothetical protein